MASHIALIESGVVFEIEHIDLFDNSTTADGHSFLDINPKGFVPVLEILPGTIMTENTSILQYNANRSPTSGLVPAPDSFERYPLQEWLGYVNSDLHRSFISLFRAATPES